MAETDQFIDQRQYALIWQGLQAFQELPGWLIAARDPDRIGEVLSQTIPEFISGQLILRECDSNSIRYKAENWMGFFEIAVSKLGESGTSKIELQGIITAPSLTSSRPLLVENSLGSKDWHAVIPELNLELWTKEPEGVLSSLEMLTDPEQSRQYLMSRIQAGSPAYQDLKIQASHPEIVRYKPGSRCTIVYHLDYASDADHHWPDLVVAKTYRKEKGQNAYESMLALWNSPLGSSNTVTIAEPLGYDSDLRIMIQGPIRQEKTLEELIVRAVKDRTTEAVDELTNGLLKTARGLAELHQSGIALGKEFGWEDDMGEVREVVDRLSVSLPQLAQAANPLIERLSHLEASSQPDPRVSAHGTFRPAQVLIHHGEIGFIDFDSFGQAEPAKDLGLFLCAFMRVGMATVKFDDDDELDVSSEPLDDAARLARFEWLMSLSESFLQEYESSYRPVNRQRVALFEALEIFILILHAWTKVKTRELKDIMYLFEHFLQAHKILNPK